MIKTITLILSLGITSLAFAATSSMVQAPTNSVSFTINKSIVNNLIVLYSQPTASSSVVGQFQSQDNLIAFYQQGDWYKAGDPKTGQVGWFNINQYNTVVGKAISPQINSYFFTVQQLNGSPQIIAYKDGKQLSDQQALALYNQTQQQIQQAQAQWQKQMIAFQQQMLALQQQISDLVKANQSLFNFPPPALVAPEKPLPVATKLNPNNKVKLLKQ